MTDRELIALAAEFRAGILGDASSKRMCYAIAAPLVALLASRGIEAELVESRLPLGSVPSNHVWLRLADGRTLDPTADQFGLPMVYLGPPKRRIHRRPGPPGRTELTAEGAAIVEAAVAWLSAEPGRPTANARRRFTRRVERACAGDPIRGIGMRVHATATARAILAGELDQRGARLTLTVAGARRLAQGGRR